MSEDLRSRIEWWLAYFNDEATTRHPDYVDDPAGFDETAIEADLRAILTLLPTEGEPVAKVKACGFDDFTGPYMDVERLGEPLPVGTLLYATPQESAEPRLDHADMAREYERGYAAGSAEVERENKILRKKLEAVERMPFCSDHRDKLRGKPCRECEVERLRKRLRWVKRNVGKAPLSVMLDAIDAALNTETDG